MLGLHRYDVHVDDPDMDHPHDFTVTALWPFTARLGGARRAILLEGAVRLPDLSRPGLPARVQQAFASNALRAVADYAVAEPHRRRVT